MKGKKVVIKEREIHNVMNLKELKQAVIKAFIKDEILLEMLTEDAVGNSKIPNILVLPEEHTSNVTQGACVHNDLEGLDIHGYVTCQVDYIPLIWKMHIAHVGDIFTGLCPKCGRKHVAVRPYKNGQKCIENT